MCLLWFLNRHKSFFLKKTTFFSVKYICWVVSSVLSSINTCMKSLSFNYSVPSNLNVINYNFFFFSRCFSFMEHSTCPCPMLRKCMNLTWPSSRNPGHICPVHVFIETLVMLAAPNLSSTLRLPPTMYRTKYPLSPHSCKVYCLEPSLPRERILKGRNEKHALLKQVQRGSHYCLVQRWKKLPNSQTDLEMT